MLQWDVTSAHALHTQRGIMTRLDYLISAIYRVFVDCTPTRQLSDESLAACKLRAIRLARSEGDASWRTV